MKEVSNNQHKEHLDEYLSYIKAEIKKQSLLMQDWQSMADLNQQAYKLVKLIQTREQITEQIAAIEGVKFQ